MQRRLLFAILIYISNKYSFNIVWDTVYYSVTYKTVFMLKSSQLLWKGEDFITKMFTSFYFEHFDVYFKSIYSSTLFFGALCILVLHANLFYAEKYPINMEDFVKKVFQKGKLELVCT